MIATALSVAFTHPALLLALFLLPVLWVILRAAPPTPLRRVFPAILLLFGLQDKDAQMARTPWWLMLIRLAALAAAILGFAGPVLNPTPPGNTSEPLLVMMDGGWASAPDWEQRQEKLADIVNQSARTGQPMALIQLSKTPDQEAELGFATAGLWQNRINGLQPDAWSPDYKPWQEKIAKDPNRFATIWISDGLERPGRTTLLELLHAKGDVRIIQGDAPLFGLAPTALENGEISQTVFRKNPGEAHNVTLTVWGPDPEGFEQLLASEKVAFGAGGTEVTTKLNLPSELRNRVRRIEVANGFSAGAVRLSDDRLKRRKVALFTDQAAREGEVLVSPLHFLRKALIPAAEVIEAPLETLLQANPDVLVMADVGQLGEVQSQAVLNWVEQGGLLLRFAGPKLAAQTLRPLETDPLLPVRLRAGGRSLGGALSWGAPKSLQTFEPGSLFHGLAVPDEVTVKTQVMAEPGPDLAGRVLARLDDGTPLVTGRDIAAGKIVLVHVAANSGWSSLPLSGLFVQMLERLALSTLGAKTEQDNLAGQTWVAARLLDGFGQIQPADAMAGVPGELLATQQASLELPPGVYFLNDRSRAVNILQKDQMLVPMIWPGSVDLDALETSREIALMPWLLLAALALLALDTLATLWVSGRLRGPVPTVTGFLAAVTLGSFVLMPVTARAQAIDQKLLNAANNTVLAYVRSGDRRLDEMARAGLYGLSFSLATRTAIEPIEPVGVDPEKDELSLYPFLYWPVSEAQKDLSAKAVRKINNYMRSGGLILFDTRDSHLGAGLGGSTANGRKLRNLARDLNIPALEPVPADHVLTRSFYLLRDFPGRHAQSDVWVEASQADAEKRDGMPFRHLNDGVSPVVMGGNDWAAAWAMNREGRFLYPVGRGAAGAQQREMALRFGVNLIMHVMTGNYKSDQVHVPALLDRLGQ